MKAATKARREIKHEAQISKARSAGARPYGNNYMNVIGHNDEFIDVIARISVGDLLQNSSNHLARGILACPLSLTTIIKDRNLDELQHLNTLESLPCLASKTKPGL